MVALDSRQQEILKNIITSHIQTRETVSSQRLAEHFHLSSATLRNEMADLEEHGFLTQPHTSAGRVPTEFGYRYYIENFLERNKISQRERQELASTLSDTHFQDLRYVARVLSEFSGQTTFVSFGKHNLYVTGLSYLFANQEFTEQSFLVNIGEIIDNLESRFSEIYDEINDLRIYVGSENPISEQLSTVMFRVRTREDYSQEVIGFLGPLRMDYSRNYSLLNYLNEVLQNQYVV